jgi:hypothetical protein
MWVLDSIANGYEPVPSLPLGVFRIGLGLAMLWKFGWDQHWGAAQQFGEGTYVRWRYERSSSALRTIPARCYGRLYRARWMAAVCFAMGFATPLAGLCLAAWFAFEFSYDHKYHTVFLGAATLILSASTGTSDHLAVALGSNGIQVRGVCRRCEADPWPQILIVLLTTQMYWSSAFHKARSGQFRSGAVLQQTVEHYAAISPSMPYREIWYGRLVARVPSLIAPRPMWGGWRAAALGSILVEGLLPVLLLGPWRLWLAGVVLGSVLHASFTLLLPRRLMPFTIATISTYVLFASPSILARHVT